MENFNKVEPYVIRNFSEQKSGLSAITGNTLEIHEWTGSGPDYLHIHHKDDEAWIVLDGCLKFRFANDEVEAPAGTLIFVPAGVAHTYCEIEPSRYLILLTPKLKELIDQLHKSPRQQHNEVMKKYDSEVLD